MTYGQIRALGGSIGQDFSEKIIAVIEFNSVHIIQHIQFSEGVLR